MNSPRSLVPKSELKSFIRTLGFDPKQTADIRLEPGRWEVTMFVCDGDGHFVVFDNEPVMVTLTGKWSDGG